MVYTTQQNTGISCVALAFGIMRNIIRWISAIIVITASAAGLFHFASPSVVLENHSSASYGELVVDLPSSRVSFGPIEPGSSQLIYFSRQTAGGDLRYSLHANGAELATGKIPYEARGQLFRVVHIIIHEDGSVSAALSG